MWIKGPLLGLFLENSPEVLSGALKLGKRVSIQSNVTGFTRPRPRVSLGGPVDLSRQNMRCIQLDLLTDGFFERE